MRIDKVPEGWKHGTREFQVRQEIGTYKVVFIDHTGVYQSYEGGKRLVFPTEGSANQARDRMTRYFGSLSK